jgi:hypothetical protein
MLVQMRNKKKESPLIGNVYAAPIAINIHVDMCKSRLFGIVLF